MPFKTTFFGLSLLIGVGVLATLGGENGHAHQSTGTLYTAAEYNSYMAASQEREPQQRIAALDAFVGRYPKSSLLPYVYTDYSTTYHELKNYPKTIEYADRLLGLGSRVEIETRLGAIATRSSAFMQSFRDTDANKERELTQARKAASQGVELLDELPMPLNITSEEFAKEKTTGKAFYHSVIGYASLELKDYNDAVTHLKLAAEAYPKDPIIFLRLGIAYLHTLAPHYLDGFSALARSAALKGPSQEQARKYLVDQIVGYQQCGCRNLAEREADQLIAAAVKLPEKQSELDIPSAADLQKIRDSAGPILDDLQKDDETSRKLWLAVCGLEFPEVAVKILESSKVDDTFEFKAFRSPVVEEIEKAKEPNMVIKVSHEAGLDRLKAGDYVRFHGILVGYQWKPFLLTWENARINRDDLPPEKVKGKKTTSKKPGRPSL